MRSTDGRTLLPTRTAALRAQLEVVAGARRWALIALGGFMLLIFVTAAYGLFVRGEDINMLGLLGGPDDGIGAFGLMMFLAVFWALGVWHAEQPSRRLYHWSLPLYRGAHDRIRVAAGALWLAAVVAAFLLATMLMAVLAGDGADIGDLPGTLWLNYFTGAITLYLFASVAAVRSEHPLAWVFGVVTAVYLGPMLVDIFLGTEGEMIEAWNSFLEGPVGPARAIGGGITLGDGALDPGSWMLTMLLWLGIGVAAVYTATLRVPDA